MNELILSSPFVAPSLYILLIVLNLALFERCRQAYTAHVANHMVFEGGPANMPRDENKTVLQQVNIATILPAVLLLIGYLALQHLIQSKDPDNSWAANAYLFLCGITLSPVLLAMLGNLSAHGRGSTRIPVLRAKLMGRSALTVGTYTRQKHIRHFSITQFCFLFSISSQAALSYWADHLSGLHSPLDTQSKPER